MTRLAVVATHPIQYHSPWFRLLARRLDLEVLYCVRQTPEGQAAAGFGVAFEWDTDLLGGYAHRWLENRARRPTVQGFAGCDTPGVGAVLREGRFDAVLLLGWAKKSLLQALWAGRRIGIPVLCRGDSQAGMPRGAAVKAMKRVVYPVFLRQFAAHLTVGKRNRDYLLRYGVPAERLFPCPHFSGYAAEERPPAAGAGDAPPVVLFVGKLIPKKRPLDLVEAAARLRDRGTACRLVVVGEGPLRPAVEALARERGVEVRFEGFRNQSELPGFYRLPGVLALPSDGGETWGLVVNECMGFGMPAVVSDAAGCAPDLVDEGRTGFTFPCGDAAALAERLGEALALRRRDPVALARDLAAKSRAYSMEAAAEGLERALAAVVRRPRAAAGAGRAAGRSAGGR
jgi:glycosyltransferase involved in cell wall biosynthesis